MDTFLYSMVTLLSILASIKSENTGCIIKRSLVRFFGNIQFIDGSGQKVKLQVGSYIPLNDDWVMTCEDSRYLQLSGKIVVKKVVISCEESNSVALISTEPDLLYHESFSCIRDTSDCEISSIKDIIFRPGFVSKFIKQNDYMLFCEEALKAVSVKDSYFFQKGMLFGCVGNEVFSKDAHIPLGIDDLLECVNPDSSKLCDPRHLGDLPFIPISDYNYQFLNGNITVVCLYEKFSTNRTLTCHDGKWDFDELKDFCPYCIRKINSNVTVLKEGDTFNVSAGPNKHFIAKNDIYKEINVKCEHHNLLFLDVAGKKTEYKPILVSPSPILGACHVTANQYLKHGRYFHPYCNGVKSTDIGISCDNKKLVYYYDVEKLRKTSDMCSECVFGDYFYNISVAPESEESITKTPIESNLSEICTIPEKFVFREKRKSIMIGCGQEKTKLEIIGSCCDNASKNVVIQCRDDGMVYIEDGQKVDEKDLCYIEDNVIGSTVLAVVLFIAGVAISIYIAKETCAHVRNKNKREAYENAEVEIY